MRAGGRKSVPREGFLIADRATHIVSTEEYSLGECLRDLLDLAARLLALGGWSYQRNILWSWREGGSCCGLGWTWGV